MNYGQVAVLSLPCAAEIDIDEARFFLSDVGEQVLRIARGGRCREGRFPGRVGEWT